MTVIGLHGGGRMAGEVVSQADAVDAIQVGAIIARTRVSWAAAVPVFSSLADLDQNIDVLVDFTLPDGVLTACQWCSESGTALMSGTTGLQTSHHEALDTASRSVPVLWSPNLSIGINLVNMLAEQVAHALGHSARVEIEDIHHTGKKDAPSGTALMLAQTVAAARNQVPDDVIYTGPAGESVNDHDICMTSVRHGDEIGRHSVKFTLAGEQVELIHSAQSRSIYALGALGAARWIAVQEPGLYSASDYLGSLANSG